MEDNGIVGVILVNKFYYMSNVIIIIGILYTVLFPIPIWIRSISVSRKLEKTKYIYSKISLLLILIAYILYILTWTFSDEYADVFISSFRLDKLSDILTITLITGSYIYNYLQIKFNK